MIHAKPEPIQESDWRDELRGASLDAAELLAALGLPATLATPVDGFPLRVPAGFVARMRHGDPDDPLLRQVLPIAAEHDVVPGFGDDPCGDLDAVAAPGLLQKYRGRPYAEQAAADPVQLRDALAALPDVEELILSGGDPLTLSDRRLGALIAAADGVPQLRRLRLHTRVPVALPARVNDALCALLAASRLDVVVVIHANHPNELDDGVAAALTRLRTHGATLLNQAVLLRGVNDSVETLASLSTRLFATGVLPYYLHMLDRAAGTAHFEVPPEAARELHQALAARLPGYLVPRLVREVPGADCKQSLEGVPAVTAHRMDSDTVLRLLIVENSRNEAQEYIKALRNAGIAARPQVAEDDEDVAELLEKQDFDMALCADQLEGTPLAKIEKQDFDMALCADQLEGTPLAKIIELVHAKSPDTPVLVTTDEFDEKHVLGALRQGAANVVSKSSPEHLKMVVMRETVNLLHSRELAAARSMLVETDRRCQDLLGSSRDAIAYAHEGMHIYANPAYLSRLPGAVRLRRVRGARGRAADGHGDSRRPGPAQGVPARILARRDRRA
jgi:L-lysine 2,3-aminomutase/DNA-binding NarL/FixJ family response regulator